MTTVSKLKAWHGAIAQPATEFVSTSLSIIEGKIPTDLRGSLYRNGPARLSWGKQQVGHWFDGDGAILRVNFTDSGATALYRYVQTTGYLAEQAASSFIFPNYGMTAAGGFWNNWLKPVKNTANTSVLALGDRLLALWEGGLPHALDLETLATVGLDNLSGLTSKQSFSAHPKVDSQTAEIFSYGVSVGLNTVLNLYKCDPTGKLQKHNTYTLSGLPLIHDFCLAGQYLVFLVSPVRIDLPPIILGKKSYSEAMLWKPELGTEVLIFERENLSLVSRSQTEPWFQWHFANGYVNDEGNIVTEFIRYQDFATNQYLKEVASGATKTIAKGTLSSLTINPQTAKVISNQKLADAQAEFPIVSPIKIGQNWRYTYLNVHPLGAKLGEELFTAIARFDRETNDLAIADLGSNCYPSEPILVPRQDDPEQGWLVTVVYDGNSDSSEVRIYQSDRLFADPVCRLALPAVIPHSFHGTWQPAA
ncbi:carotenoid oxygenase [Chondrocystis sp. NIES-4102]|nr:carotenoid oxygenase [Chondrocystis sp. NIES-4102]